VSITETKIDNTERMAGITDAAWWDWFGEIDSSYDTWVDWLSGCRFPHEGPLPASLENDIESAIRSADRRRLDVVPTTAHFTTIWDNFRRQHEDLDQRGKYCRMRYMVWRAAALKALIERNAFQDVVDAQQARDVLTQTYRYFWPTIDADGNCDGSNFWQPKLVNFSDGTQSPDPLTSYAPMVLTLLRQAVIR
jgi:hypothetical protein